MKKIVCILDGEKCDLDTRARTCRNAKKMSVEGGAPWRWQGKCHNRLEVKQ